MFRVGLSKYHPEQQTKNTLFGCTDDNSKLSHTFRVPSLFKMNKDTPPNAK